MIFLLWTVNSASLYYMMHHLNRNHKHIHQQWLLVCILQFLLLLQLQQNQVHLFLFYLVLYVSKLLIFQILDDNHHWRLIVTNISFISMISCHLVAIALIALCCQCDMSTIIQTSQFTISCYMLYLFVDALINLLLVMKKDLLMKLFTHTVHQQYRNFECFLWFCDIFLMIQSILCQQDHFPVYISIFLICNDVLMMTLVFCFIHNIYEINDRSYVEKEHEQLQNESKQRRKNMEDMKQYADYDILTGAHSRKYTMQYLATLLQQKTPFSIAFIDLDQLKKINDVYGHSAGDQYLRSFAESMEVFLYDGDVLGRIGGDEFLFIMKQKTQDQAQQRMDFIYDSIQKSTQLNAIYFSYGVVANDGTQQDLDAMIQAADQLMYQQKKQHQKGESI